MKVRFYCDLAPNFDPRGQFFLSASTLASYAKPIGFKRLAFDVDIPPEFCKAEVDAIAPTIVVGEVV